MWLNSFEEAMKFLDCSNCPFLETCKENDRKFKYHGCIKNGDIINGKGLEGDSVGQS